MSDEYETIGHRREKLGGIPQPRYICAKCYEHNLLIALQQVGGELVCPVCGKRSPSPENKEN